MGATYSTYAFTPEINGKYSVHVEVTDARGAQTRSDALTDITVNEAGTEDNGASFPTLFVAILVVLVIVTGILIYSKRRKR